MSFDTRYINFTLQITVLWPVFFTRDLLKARKRRSQLPPTNRAANERRRQYYLHLESGASSVPHRSPYCWQPLCASDSTLFYRITTWFAIQR